MTKLNENSDKADNAAANKAVSGFVSGLADEYRMLVILKAQLYDGKWEPMLEDLRNRLEGKPYIFKLASRIKDDIVRIEEMSEFEAKNNVDLANYINIL